MNSEKFSKIIPNHNSPEVKLSRWQKHVNIDDEMKTKFCNNKVGCYNIE